MVSHQFQYCVTAWTVKTSVWRRLINAEKRRCAVLAAAKDKLNPFVSLSSSRIHGMIVVVSVNIYLLLCTLRFPPQPHAMKWNSPSVKARMQLCVLVIIENLCMFSVCTQDIRRFFAPAAGKAAVQKPAPNGNLKGEEKKKNKPVEGVKQKKKETNKASRSSWLMTPPQSSVNTSCIFSSLYS